MSDLRQSTRVPREASVTPAVPSVPTPPSVPSGASGFIHSITHAVVVIDPMSLSLDIYNQRDKLASATEEEVSEIMTKHFQSCADNCRLILDLGDIHVTDYKVVITPANYHSKWKRDVPEEEESF